MRKTRLGLAAVLAMGVVWSVGCTKVLAYERGGQHNGNRHVTIVDRGDHRGSERREVVVYRGERYDYHGGRFYRPGFFGLVFNLVIPPRGVVVRYLPAEHRTIIVKKNMYYEYANIYYKSCPGGYVVVEKPVVIKEYVQPKVVYVPGPNIVAPAQPQTSDRETITVNVPTLNRGAIAITLVRFSNGFVGPQGEFYSIFPSVEELKSRYG